MKNKAAVNTVLIILTFLLMFLPIILTFNDVLTKIVMRISVYKLIQEYIVPYEIKIIGYIVRSFGIDFIPLRDSMIVKTQYLRMSWNCIGWQSLLLYLVSLFIGLRSGSFTLISKIETIVIGILGIFWINIFRVSITVLLAVYSKPIFRIVFHDLLAAVVTICFLAAFWWLAFTYLLDNKKITVN